MKERRDNFLLDFKEAAKFLESPLKRIKVLIEKGKLHPIKIGDKEYLYMEELLKWQLIEEEVEINTCFPGF